MAKITTLPVKERKAEKVNVHLMEENIMLKAQVADQLKLIESMRARKQKAHRRLKALRELSRHVEFLQTQNLYLQSRNELLQTRLLTKVQTPAHPRPILKRLFNV